MKFMKSLFLAATAAMLFGSQANAGFVFDISGMTITPGSGIGVDSPESKGQLLGVVTTTAPLPSAVELDAAGQFYSFNGGTLNFSAAETTITAGETDSLDYTITLTFSSPLIGAVDLHLVGTAFTGPVSDAAPDFTLVQTSPVHVFFGKGGEFEISVGKIALTKGGIAGLQNIPITITLDSAPVVPEPSSMALLGLGGIGLAFARNRKRFKSAV